MITIEYIYDTQKLFSVLFTNITNFFSKSFAYQLYFNIFNYKRLFFDIKNIRLAGNLNYDPIITWHFCFYLFHKSLEYDFYTFFSIIV